LYENCAQSNYQKFKKNKITKNIKFFKIFTYAISPEKNLLLYFISLQHNFYFAHARYSIKKIKLQRNFISICPIAMWWYHVVYISLFNQFHYHAAAEYQLNVLKMRMIFIFYALILLYRVVVLYIVYVANIGEMSPVF
jgi:hypothetical protein